MPLEYQMVIEAAARACCGENFAQFEHRPLAGEVLVIHPPRYFGRGVEAVVERDRRVIGGQFVERLRRQVFRQTGERRGICLACYRPCLREKAGSSGSNGVRLDEMLQDAL